MRKLLWLLMVACLIPFFAQAQKISFYSKTLKKEVDPTFSLNPSRYSTANSEIIKSMNLLKGNKESAGVKITKAVLGYDVYRVLKGQTQDQWTSLATDITVTTYTDNTWGTLESEAYNDAVIAKYPLGVLSDSALSNIYSVVPTYAVIFVVTDHYGEPLRSAVVRVIGQGAGTLTNIDGIAVYPTLLEDGEYIVTVTKSGYMSLVKEFIVNGGDLTINLGTCVNIEGINAGEFLLYPNPVNETLTIVRGSTNKAIIEIYNNNGIIMQSVETNVQQQDINIANFSTGIYLIRVIEDQGIRTQRLIKN